MRMRRTRTALAVLLALTLLAAACGSDDPAPDDAEDAEEATDPEPADDDAPDPDPSEDEADPDEEEDRPTVAGGTLTVGLSSEPVSLDPGDGLFIAEHQVLMHVFDTLLRLTPDGALVPGLATEWSANDEGTSFAFTLRDDVIFHDGTPLDAEAVIAQFDRLAATTDGAGVAPGVLAGYEGASAEGNTIEVTFSDAKPELLRDLTRAWMGIPSPAAMADGADPSRQPVGSGPFVLEQWDAQDRMVLRRNDDYAWGAVEFGHDGPPLVDELIIRFLPDPSSRMAAFETGEIDIVEEPQFLQVEGLVESGRAQLASFQAPGMPTHMMLNTDNPPTDDPVVREAMILAVDTAELVATAFAGLQSPASNVLSPTTFGFSPEAAATYAPDPAAATALLEEAGWVDEDGDGVREKDGQRLTLEYPASPDWEGAYMELLTAYLTAAGFEVNLTQMDDAGIFEVANAGEHHLVSMAWISGSPSVLPIVYHSDNIEQGSAFTRFRDAELDGLFDEAAVTVDDGQRSALYAQAQIIIMDNALAIPLYTLDRVLLLQPELSGFAFDAEGYAWLPGVAVGG